MTIAHTPPRRWTPAEDQVLLGSVARVSLATIAKRLNRTPLALQFRLRHYGINARTEAKRKAGMSRLEVAQALGVQYAQVHHWIRCGWLVEQYAPMVHTRTATIDADAVLVFLRERGGLLPSLRPVPLWRDEFIAAQTALQARYVTRQEVCAALLLARQSINDLMRQQGFPQAVINLGRRLPHYFARADVRVWLNAHPQYETKATRDLF